MTDVVLTGAALTIDDVLNSRMIVDPLHLYEIVSPVSGGAAVIVASPEVAKRSKNPPVWLIGGGEYANHSTITYAPSLTESPVKPAAEAAFKMSGLRPKDMHLVCPYDCYTITVIVTLEDAGFCKKGQGGKFVWDHDLSYAGDFPCNTHGGQLSFGPPGLGGGMSHVTSAQTNAGTSHATSAGMNAASNPERMGASVAATSGSGGARPFSSCGLTT